MYLDVLAALPVGAPQPTECEVLSWFSRNYASDSVAGLMYREPFDTCIPQMCAKLSLAGNADIAGIGMLTAYLMEALMATGYVIVLLSWQRRARGKGSDSDLKMLKMGRVPSAVMATVDDFLDTALFFSGAIIIAGIAMTPLSRKPYELLQATLASSLTLSSAGRLEPARQHDAPPPPPPTGGLPRGADHACAGVDGRGGQDGKGQREPDARRV